MWYVHISVGFCVARSNGKGNARRLKYRSGQQYGNPRFFVSVPI